ncbi:MAG: hypothetical protein AAFV33_10520 [Chloroflexota bacterium]
MTQNNVQVYWHRYGRVLVQRFIGNVSYVSLVNGITELERNIINLKGHIVPCVIIDMTDRAPDMDMSIFTFANLRRLLPENVLAPAGMHIIMVDRDPGYTPVQRLAAMLNALGYDVSIMASFEDAVDVAEQAEDMAATG